MPLKIEFPILDDFLSFLKGEEATQADAASLEHKLIKPLPQPRPGYRHLRKAAEVSAAKDEKKSVTKLEKPKPKTRKEILQAEFDALSPEKQKEYRDIGKIYKDMLRERDADYKDSLSDELPNINAEALRDKLKDKIAHKKIKIRLPQVRKLNTIIAMCKEGVI